MLSTVPQEGYSAQIVATRINNMDVPATKGVQCLVSMGVYKVRYKQYMDRNMHVALCEWCM